MACPFHLSVSDGLNARISNQFGENKHEQESIPLGCVPPAWKPYVLQFQHRRYNKQMQQLLYEPMCQLFCSAPSGSETQLQICY